MHPIYHCPSCKRDVPASETSRYRRSHVEGDRRTVRGFKHVGCGTIISVTMIFGCSDHISDEAKLGYIDWHERAERSMKNGEQQDQCSECKRFFFAWERPNQ